MSTFDNFVQCRVASPIAASATSLELYAAVAPYNLPPETGGVLVLTDSPGNPSKIEVIRYASRSALGLYGVERGQEGTTAIDWTGPVYCYQALMSGEMQSILSSIASLNTSIGGDSNFSGTMSTELAKKVDKVTGKSLSANDFTNNLLSKLNGIADAATKNATDSQLRARASHTGTQPVSTITGLGNTATDNYGTSVNTVMMGNDARVVGAASRSYTNTELGKKVDKEEGKSLVASTEIVRLLSMATGSTKNRSDSLNADKIHGHDIATASASGFMSAAHVAALEEAGKGKMPPNLFSKPVRGKPMLTKVSATSISLPAGLAVAALGVPITLTSSITLTLSANLKAGTATPGTDYFVYLKPDATAYISASDTETDARLVGGFHYGLTGHTETPSGNKTEADMVKLRGINAHTFWDLTFRANKWTNRGLTFDGINWIDIYLADEEYAVRGWSKAGGWIAGGATSYGRKHPVIPEMFGGNGSATYGKLTPFVARDMLNAAGMEPINYKQFSHAMYGVEEGLPSASIETVTGKIEHYPRLTSRYGVEQATGVQWIWGADFGGSSSGSWQGVTDSRGHVYSGVIVSAYGAHRDAAAGPPGSRASAWNLGLTNSHWSYGVRGLRDHVTLD